MLFLLYVVVVAFVLYLNGVFTGEWEASVNLIINVGFLLMIGILFGISSISFGRLGQVTRELEEVGLRLQRNIRRQTRRIFGQPTKMIQHFSSRKTCRRLFKNTVCG